MMRRLISLLSLLAVAACGGGAQEPAKPEHHEEESHGARELKVPEETQKKWGLVTGPVTRETLTGGVTLPGVIALNQQRSAQISTLLEGKVISVGADLGDQVRAGQPLVVLHAPAFAQAQTALLQAHARRNLARREFDRARELLKDEAIQQREYQRRQAELEAATTDYGLAESQLHSLGWGHPQIDALVLKAGRAIGDLSDLVEPTLRVTSPIDGRVIARDVVVGEHVHPDKLLFTVSDLAHRSGPRSTRARRTCRRSTVGSTRQRGLRGLPGPPVRGARQPRRRRRGREAPDDQGARRGAQSRAAAEAEHVRQRRARRAPGGHARGARRARRSDPDDRGRAVGVRARPTTASRSSRSSIGERIGSSRAILQGLDGTRARRRRRRVQPEGGAAEELVRPTNTDTGSSGWWLPDADVDRTRSAHARTLIAFSLRNRLLVGLALVLLVGIGAWSIATIPIDAFPDVTNIQVEVVSTAPGPLAARDRADGHLPDRVGDARAARPGHDAIGHQVRHLGRHRSCSATTWTSTSRGSRCTSG